jgi:very-short-patch-repair endonuclease
MKLEHERLISLIEFAKESAKLRGNPVCDIANHLFHEYEHSLQGLPGVHFNPGGEEDELWLVVDRLRESNAPTAKKPLLNLWLDVSNNPSKEPSLKTAVEMSKLIDAGLIKTEKPQSDKDQNLVLFHDFEQADELQGQFKSYLDTQWIPWSVEEKNRRKTIQLYGRLFTLKQQLEGSITDAQVEIAWGVGISVWNMNGTKVAYPLITRLVDININELTMAIEIRPRDIEPQLEMDIYAAADNPGTAELEKAYKDFNAKRTQTFSPYDRGTFEGILRSAVACLDSKGVYWPSETTADDRKTPSASEELRITDTWALLARPRSKSLFVQDLERFKNNLEENIDEILPKAISAILTEPSTSSQEISFPGFRGISIVHGNEGGAGSSSKEVSDLYFPMPFNDEQVRIVQMLERYDGVVVQGPPGTGKTHTIANIISHYFALGKRVLVTSMKEPALAVLRDKLPEEIRPLAISLLSNEQEGMKQFEHAISRIASEIQVIDKSAYRKEIAYLEQSINGTHSSLAKIDRDIAGWAKKNLEQIIFENEAISPLDAAHTVVKGQGQYEWIEDSLSINNTPLFSNDDIAQLREARRLAANDMHYLNVLLPEISSFPNTQELLRVHQDLSRHAELEAAIASGELSPLADSSEGTIEAAHALLEKIKTLITLNRKIECFGSWYKSARNLLKQPSESLPPILEIFDSLCAEIKTAIAERREFLSRPVSVPQGMELDDEIMLAIKNKILGKSPFGIIGLVGKNAEKRKLEEIRIMTNAPESPDDWKHVEAYLHLQRRFRDLIARWDSVAPDLALECFKSYDQSHIMQAGEYFSQHLILREHIKLGGQVIASIQEVLPGWNFYTEIEENPDLLAQLQEILDNHIRRSRLSNALTTKDRLQESISCYQGNIVTNIKTFITENLGNPLTSDAEFQALWSSLLDELRRIHGLKGAFTAISNISHLIEKSGASMWADALRTASANQTVDLLLPDNWREAWRLKQLAVYLEKSDAREDLKKLARDRRNNETQLEKTYKAIVSKRTWLKLAENATPDIRAALEAFRTAISKIGKGTGKRAVIFRQNARRASERANSAIPCWIMPHWRVSESLPSQLGCFDLVIIDEASQSDFSALPALLRAKKVLIVGDDKQVSPDGGFVEIDKIKNLMARYLTTQVDIYRAQMDPGQSIYDLFKVVFAQSGTMLKEHFRCVGPIIEYSKREFYNHELKPVRLPKFSERLDPPLVDVLVEDGFRKGDINIPEARFIVDEIKRICADEKMQRRTIGIVSLLGDKQALEIWKMIEAELGPEEIKRHEIACGDARTFQGKERDIMFLSMIVSPNDAHALTKDSAAQRINVAASRARDRMYLVRSIELDQLSNSDKLRRGLISHFSSPFAQDEQRVENLRQLCESDFEREIYDILTERGYRVMPQVKVGEFRIDMVVEGLNDLRLAIECDGDRYHGADRWDDDMNRQRILERVGWQFWRSFASTFVKNKREVVEDLVNSLAERGIEPIGKDTAPRSFHTEQRKVVAFPVVNQDAPEGPFTEELARAATA